MTLFLGNNAEFEAPQISDLASFFPVGFLAPAGPTYNAQLADFGKLINSSGASGTLTVNLPTAQSINTPIGYVIGFYTWAGNNIIVNSGAGGLITPFGQASVTLQNSESGVIWFVAEGGGLGSHWFTWFSSHAVLNDGSFGSAQQQNLYGGFYEVPFSLGTITTGTVTLDPGKNLKQTLINNGAFTLSPGSFVGDIELYITNGATAGAITFTGWTKQWTGDSLDTTNAHEFVVFCYLMKNNAGTHTSAYLIKAMQ